MSLSPFTVYDAATGEILRTGFAVEEDAMLQASGPGEAVVLETLDAATQYLPGGVVSSRPVRAFSKTTIVADGIDVAVLEIPGPFTVIIDGAAYAVEDSLEIASHMPATYRVEVDHFPYLPIDVEIIAQ